MHPALLIPEIIYKVCDCFVIPADRKALLALSCTCKAFSEPANDALWRYIRGITTFSKMLFPDPPEEEVTAAGAWRSRSERFQAFVAERERLIAQGLDEKRRDRVLACARRVRRIEMGSSHMDDPETYTFFAFITAYPPKRDPTRQSQAILPNLRELECTFPSVHGVTHAIHLIQFTSDSWVARNSATNLNDVPRSPDSETAIELGTEVAAQSSLKSLSIAANVPWTYQVAAQTLVDERFIELSRSFKSLVRLERLDFRCDQLSAAVELALAKSLKWLSSLKYAKLGFKKAAMGWAMISIAGHKQLKEIQMDVSRDDVPGGLEPHPSGPFVELLSNIPPKSLADAEWYESTEIVRSSAIMETMLDILDFFKLPASLRQLFLHVETPTPEKLTQLLRYVTGFHTPDLHTVLISDSRLSWIRRVLTGTTVPFTVQSLSTLLMLPQLTELTIDLHVVFHLTDEDLGMMASAWPHMRKLAISPFREVDVPKPATLPSFWGLQALTDGCVMLEELKLKIDASRNAHGFMASLTPLGQEWNDTQVSSARPPSRLKTWFVGESFIQEGDAELVTDIIKTLFPTLEALVLPHESNRLIAKWGDWIDVRKGLFKDEPKPSTVVIL